MPGKHSAGLLLYRCGNGHLEVFLVHPGGPFFARRDAGAWSVPKGEIESGEAPLAVALREFTEETGQAVERCAKAGVQPIELGAVRQRGGKMVHVWAVEGDWPADVELRSNTFEIEWPPRSGQRRSFPEVDRAAFFRIEEARAKIHPDQAELLERLIERIAVP